jgi:glycosyltransferase involved in cell wall biosynthesis
MEALSLEIPVIASTARGNRELVGDDRGRIFETGDVPALADAMAWLIDHPDAGAEMGRRGRARMVERYDIQVLMEMHEELYRGLLAERATS